MKDQLAQDRFLLSQPKLRSKPAQKIVDLLLDQDCIKATWETVGLSPASSVCASAFRLRVSIVVRTRRLTAVNVLLIRLRQGRNHWVVAARLNVRAAARPSWAALTIPRARVTNTTTWHRS